MMKVDRPAVDARRKDKQEKFRSHLGLLVDVPKPDCGTTEHSYGTQGRDRKNFDFDQSLDSEKKKPSVEETRRHFLETSFNLCRGRIHHLNPA
ncbi:hypothetical protein TNCV_1604501 [Trichonephila clavipes]|nr:hypothetical protein TNCV_1604501 [Trichonephila clavipes]